MQGPKGNHSQARRNQGQKSTGRVVDIKAWKAKRRLQNVRGRRSWFHTILYFVTIVLLILSGVFATLSCIPITIQLSCIVSCAFFASISCSLSIWLYVMRERLASKFLSIGFICLALSIVAGAIRLN